MHCESPIKRRVSRKIWVGSVAVGGDAPISVQSMTNTDTCDVAATVAQIRRLEDAGADIVRVSVPDMDAGPIRTPDTALPFSEPLQESPPAHPEMPSPSRQAVSFALYIPPA